MNRFFNQNLFINYKETDVPVCRACMLFQAKRSGVLCVLSCILPCLLVLLSSCSRPGTETSKNDDVIRHPLVLTSQVQVNKSNLSPKFSGIAKEGRTVKMSFRVPGPLVELNVEIGKQVKKGDLLAKIDSRDYELAVRQVEANLKEANAALRAMKTGARAEDLAALKAAVTAAESQYNTAEKMEKRFANLLTTQSVPQAKYDEIKMKFDQAGAALEAARQTLEKGKTGARPEEIEAMEAKISGLKVIQQKAQNALSDVSLYAPTDGYVSQKYVESGEIVAPGIPVLAFTDSTAIRVQTTVSESILIKRNEIVGFECEFEAYPGKKFKATLSELGQAQQAGKQGYPMEVAIASENKASLHPGMAAVVTVHFKGGENEFLIPLASIVGDEESAKDGSGKSQDSDEKAWSNQSRETYVWQVEAQGETLKKKSVKLVRLVDDGVIVTGELTAGDRIVSAGARFLRENEKVRVK